MAYRPPIVRPPDRPDVEEVVRARLERQMLVQLLANRLRSLLGSLQGPPRPAGPGQAAIPPRAPFLVSVAAAPRFAAPPPPTQPAFVPPPMANVNPGPNMLAPDWFRQSRQPGVDLGRE